MGISVVYVRHHRSDAYSAEQVLLNKRQIYGGTPKLHWYLIMLHILWGWFFCLVMCTLD